MYHSPRDRARTAARLLLLGIAVAACGGGDTRRTGQDGDASDVSADTTGAPRARVAGANCPPPPSIDPALLGGAKWDSLVVWLRRNRVQFVPGGPPATRRVLLERGSTAPALLSIASENRTHCLSRDSVTTVVRLTGMIRVDSATTAWGHPFAKGDSILLFAQGEDALLAYDEGGRVRTAPPRAWSFFYCLDTVPAPRPASAWRDWTPGPPQGDDDDPGTYGWMACASGCCQFYIPPKEEEGEGRGRGGRRPPTPCTPGH